MTATSVAMRPPAISAGRNGHVRKRGGQVRQETGLARRQQRQDRGDIAADRHEGRVAEREQAGEPVGDVEADRENDIDADEGDDRQEIGIDVAVAA